MHNKLTKEQRQNAMEKFRKGQIKILVSSDISARGLDIENVTHIINLDFLLCILYKILFMKFKR